MAVNDNNDLMLELVSEIREDVKEVRTDLKTLMTQTYVNERDLTWIKGGLTIALTCIIAIVGYLAQIAMSTFR